MSSARTVLTPETSRNTDDVATTVLRSSSYVVSPASSLLIKELAIGIEIAEFVETRLLDTIASSAKTVLRSLDALPNIVTALMPSFELKAGGESTENSIVVEMPGPLSPGQTGERVVLLSSDSDAPIAEFGLSSNDLVASSGNRISAEHVRFDPSSLSLPAQGSANVVVSVKVPDDLPGGRYEGRLQGQAFNQQGIVLRVDVASERA